MLFVEKVDKVAELTKRLEATRVSPKTEETKSCCALSVIAVAVLNCIELVRIANDDKVLGIVANPPPVVTPIIDDA